MIEYDSLTLAITPPSRSPSTQCKRSIEPAPSCGTRWAGEPSMLCPSCQGLVVVVIGNGEFSRNERVLLFSRPKTLKPRPQAKTCLDSSRNRFKRMHQASSPSARLGHYLTEIRRSVRGTGYTVFFAFCLPFCISEPIYSKRNSGSCYRQTRECNI